PPHPPKGFPVISCPAMPMVRRAFIAIILAGGASVTAADWPQFLGPARNGLPPGPLAPSWPAAGPRKVWQKRVGKGFAGPVVVGDRLILFHRVANEEVVDGLDTKSGECRCDDASQTM